KYCNGGSISYVELGEAPIHNPNALSSILKYAMENNINYLGFNFPLDICKKCGHEGFYNSCPNCGSPDIYRIRRVSGYLEMLDNFGKGKLNEENNRRKNHFGA
ncbi:MAG: anaerobic ribonucleoside triphosphate reductase, partial [Fermentimonas sp.]|nr:anaerobic ribonucleoside triphosphate reductase [Fermentimonas sp.]